MKTSKLLWLALLFSALFTVSCSDDDNKGGNTPPPSGGEVNGEMKSLQLKGYVHDADGQPLAGVTVTSGTSKTQTDAAGLFALNKLDVVSSRPLVRFAKSGYFDVVRSFKANSGDEWEVIMCSKSDGSMSTSAVYEADEARTISVGDMRIDMPENGYMTDSNGKPYSGTVHSDMVYLDPNNEHFAEMMPGGDLAAVRADNTPAQLLSYGMTAVSMTDDNGNKLQLKEGSTARLTFPVPQGMEASLPASIPLWSFDETKGVWVEEGSAQLQGNVYVGTVSHFSWVNLDYPESQGTVQGYVKDQFGNPISGVRVSVGQVMSPTLTNAQGYYKQDVPANVDFNITVKPKYYGNYQSVVNIPVSELTAGETRTVHITLPRLYNVSGRIVNQLGDSNSASIWLEYGNGQRTLSVVSNANTGAFKFYAPEGYTGPARLVVLTGDEETVTRNINLTNNDLNVGDIVISSTSGSSGTINTTLSDGTSVTFNLPGSDPNTMSGVIIVDDMFVYTSGEPLGDDSEEPEFILQIEEGYNADRQSYDNAMIYAYNKNTGAYLANDYSGHANISLNGKKCDLSVSGTGTYISYADDKYDENATFNSSEVKLDVLLQGKTVRNMMPSQAGLPSFTPALSQPAPLIMAFSACKMCDKGGTAYYDGGIEEYETLVAAANKTGIKKLYSENDGDYAEALYFSNNKFILIVYDSYIQEGNEGESGLDTEAPVTVTALEGVDESIFDMLSASDDEEVNIAKKARLATKKDIRALLKKLKK